MLNLLLTAVLATSLQAGQRAPDFTATDTDGKKLVLKDLLQTGPVVLVFFPKAFTGGCTKELTSYRELGDELKKRDGQVIAVSTDDLETQKKFKASLNAPYSFVADADKKLTELFDVKMPVTGLSSRYTFVIGQDGNIARVDEGSAAIDAASAVKACPLRKPAAGMAPPSKK